MSRAQNRLPSDNVGDPLMKVNQLINSIFAMNQTTLAQQLQTCSKIIAQLLQNQLLNYFTSLPAIKLLCYELILLIAEQNAMDSRPRLSMMENAFGNNKKIRLTSSLKNTLSSINQILEDIVWKNTSVRKGGTEKNIGENSAMYHNYVQFKHLLSDFDKQLKESQSEKILIPPLYQSSNYKNPRTGKKMPQPESSEQDENEALIEQYEEMVAKKEKRIKELNEELEESILQQKAQEDLIIELQSRNMDMREQIRLLNEKITKSDSKELQLQEKIQQLRAKIVLQERQISAKKAIPKTQKTIKTQLTMDEIEQLSGKKQYKQAIEEKPNICLECQQKKDISLEDVNNLRRILLTQCISIQALI